MGVYSIEMYWKSKTTLVFCNVFTMSFTLASMPLNTSPLFLCSLMHGLWLSSANKRVIRQDCWVWGVPGCTKLPVPVQSHSGERGGISWEQLSPLSCSSLTYLGWPLQCDGFDAQKGWLSRLDPIQKLIKVLKGERPCSEKNWSFMILIVSLVFKT